MFRVLAISSKEMWASSSIMAYTLATNLILYFLLFFTLPLLLKMLDFPSWKCSTHQKTVVLKELMRGLQISGQREFLSRIVREWHIPWCRTWSRWPGVRFFPKKLGSYMAHKKCCEINTLVLFCVNFCMQTHQIFLFSVMLFVLLWVQFCNDFKGGLIQNLNTLVYISVSAVFDTK